MESERRIHELEQRVAVLTEALQKALVVIEQYEPCGDYCTVAMVDGIPHADHQHPARNAILAALAATAGTAGTERAGRVQKLEALAKVARVIDKQPDFFSPGWRALHHALADLDAEAQASGGPSTQA